MISQGLAIWHKKCRLYGRPAEHAAATLASLWEMTIISPGGWQHGIRYAISMFGRLTMPICNNTPAPKRETLYDLLGTGGMVGLPNTLNYHKTPAPRRSDHYHLLGAGNMAYVMPSPCSAGWPCHFATTRQLLGEGQYMIS